MTAYGFAIIRDAYLSAVGLSMFHHDAGTFSANEMGGTMTLELSKPQQVDLKKVFVRPRLPAIRGLKSEHASQRRLKGLEPKYLSLGGRAIGYHLDDLDKWLAGCSRIHLGGATMTARSNSPLEIFEDKTDGGELVGCWPAEVALRGEIARNRVSVFPNRLICRYLIGLQATGAPEKKQMFSTRDEAEASLEAEVDHHAAYRNALMRTQCSQPTRNMRLASAGARMVTLALGTS